MGSDYFSRALLFIALTSLFVPAECAYRGCFLGFRRRPNYGENPGVIRKGTVTPENCYTACGAFKYTYAILKAGSFCLCENRLPSVLNMPQVADSFCNMACVGDNTKMCGSMEHLSIYDAVPPLTVAIVASPDTIAVGNTVAFAPTFTPSNANAALRFDYDDGADMTAYTTAGANLTTHVFHKAGLYSVDAYANTPDQLLQPFQSSIAVLVESPGAGVNVTCPAVMATYEDYTCEVSVSRGTNMKVTLTHTDGNPGPAVSATFDIADALEFMFGNPVQGNIIDPVGSSVSTLVVGALPATQKGTLDGVEYYAVATGTLTLHVYRPQCALGQEFCVTDKTCKTIGTCHQCGVNHFCSDINTCCNSVPTTGLGATLTYVSVATTPITITQTGLSYTPWVGEFEILPGDVLAHNIAGSSLLAVRNVSTGQATCSSITAPADMPSSSCTTEPQQHQLKAVVVQKSKIYYPMSFTTNGNVTLTATVNNPSLSVSVVGSTEISVQLGVDRAVIKEIATCLPQGQARQVEVLPYTGDMVTVLWDWGDGSTSNGNVVSKTYSSIGTFNVSVNISNAISFKHNWTVFCVEQTISGVALNLLDGVEVNVPTGIQLTMITGSNYTCTYSFAYQDGSADTLTRTEADGPLLTYTFRLAGAIQVQCICSNTINSVTFSKTVTAVERISGAGLSPPGAMKGKTFNIVLAWATGSDVSVTLTYDGVPQPMTIEQAQRRAVGPSMIESLTGTHYVVYEIWNSLSSSGPVNVAFGIEVKITSPDIVCTFPDVIKYIDLDVPVILLSDTIQCDITMTDGTSVNIFMDHGDGTNRTEINTPGIPWSANVITLPLIYAFISTGLHNVRVKVYNNFNFYEETYPVWVMMDVNSVAMVPSVSIKEFLPPADVDFYFTGVGSIAPNDVTCSVEWGDNNHDVIYPCDLTTIYSHRYFDKDGPLPFSYTLSNLISSVTNGSIVNIVSPIVDMECYTDPIAGIPEVPIDLVFKARRAPPAGVLSLTFDCNTLVAGTDATRLRQENSPNGQDRHPCTYAHGNYTQQVIATSLLETKTCSNVVRILYPVTQAFTFTALNAPMNYEVSPSCLINYQMTYTGTPIPDDALIVYDHGDGTPATTPVPWQAFKSHSYQYAKPGHYLTTITMYNDASKVNRTIVSGCYAQFFDTTITILRQARVPVGGQPVVGFGAGKDKFLISEEIVIAVSHNTGTFVWYEAMASSATDIFSCNSTNEKEIRMNITQPGVYTVTVQAKNPIHSGPIQTSVIEMISPVSNISITDNGIITKAYDTKTFHVSMDSYGTAMCVAVSFSTDDPRVWLYGDSVTCNVASVPYFSNRPVWMGKADVTKAFVVSTDTYLKESTYVMQIYAWNMFSSAIASFEFPVSQISCSAPNLNIIDRRPIFRYPVTFRRSKRIKVIGITDLACPNTLKNTKQWKCERWDATNDVWLADVDITSIPSSINSELAFEPNVLPLGLYRLTYIVTMDTTGGVGEKFSAQTQTFIEVIKSDIVVQLFANTVFKQTVGSNSVLTISPRDNSYDPDVDRAVMPDIFDKFDIACRDVTLNENFTNLNDLRVSPANLSSLPFGFTDSGGCFRQGPGWLDDTDGSVTFHTSILKVGHLYELRVIGYKDTRWAEFLGQINVISGEPPEVDINFKIPTICKPGPIGKLFNPNSELGMVASVKNPCTGCTYTYQWQMFAKDFHFCDCCECWRDLVFLSKYIEGLKSRELTVKTEVFSHYPDVDDFQLRLFVTNNVNNVTSESIMSLIRNRPPYGGNCTISPGAGVAQNTSFSIKCEGFEDDYNEIEKYAIKCQTINGKEVDIADGANPDWSNRLLPVGDLTNGNELNCSVHVKDSLGSIGIYPINTVTVDPLPLTEMRGLLLGMLNSTADPSDLVEASANLDETCSFLNSLSSMFQVLGENDEYTDYKGMGSALSYTPSCLSCNDTRPGAFSKDVDDKTKMEMYEEIRDAGAQLVSQLVTGTLSKCTIESTDETIRMCDSLATISGNPTFLTRETQNQVTDFLEKAIDNIKKAPDSMTVEEIEAVTALALETCTNIEQAANLGRDHPTKSDLKTQDVKVPFFSTNMDSTLDDVPAFDNDVDALASGKHIMNKEEQTLFTMSSVSTCAGIADDLIKILTGLKPMSDQPIEMKSGSIVTSVTKNTGSALENKTLPIGDCAIDLPSGMIASDHSDEPMIIQVSTRAAPGAPVDDGSPMGQHHRQVTIEFSRGDGTEYPVRNLTTPVIVTIAEDPNAPQFNWSGVDLAKPVIPADRADEVFFYHEVFVNNPAAIQIKFRPTNISKDNQLLVLVNFDEKPSLSVNKTNVKAAGMIPRNTRDTGFYGNAKKIDPYTLFVDKDVVGNDMGSWKIAVRQLLPHEINEYPDVASLPDTVPDEWKTNKLFTQDYQLFPVVMSCAFTRKGSSIIQTDGVKPSEKSGNSVVCETTHLTSFGGNLVVAPNKLDWNFIFSNADFMKNPTLYVTLIVVMLFYIVAMIWARRKDKQDITKLGLCPLLDNDPKDHYYYEVLVSTGMRRGAGTESKVHFVLSGEEEETDVRTFSDSKRKIFTRGSNDGFLMAVPEPLGPLTYLRIWHDNSGKGRFASWYLNHVLVRDVQTGRKYYFIANRWFAVEEDDGQVDRVIPVAGREQMTEFTHLFQQQTARNLSDGHLWFSVVARPPNSRFTRCQRVSCCLCLLYSSMLANAMFYNKATDDSNAYTVGPFAITSEQIFIGIASNLIIFPINFILITIFRKSRPRWTKKSRVQEAIDSMPQRSASMADVKMREKSSLDFDRPGSSFLIDGKPVMSRPESCMSTTSPHEAAPNKKPCELPWWFVIVGWVLLWAAVLVSGAFVAFYGIQFQDMKCKKWITSMLISFVTSIFFTQPIKVFLFAIIFSLLIKKPENDEEVEDEEPRRLREDEQFLHVDEDDEFGLLATTKPIRRAKPPDSKFLAKAREERLKEIQMWSIIREILFYAFFLWILIVISYRSVSTNSYQYKKTMEQVFILTNDTHKSFTSIGNTKEFWMWAQSGMLRGIRAGPYYNNFPPFYMRGYIDDKQSRLMGYAVLRQVRVTPDSCKVPGDMRAIIEECNAQYELSVEEKGDFGPGWTTTPNASREEYMYKDADSLNGYPYWGQMALYGGGGYVVKLNKDYQEMIKDLEQLETEGWIDRYTRAVFMEFTVYNPSVNLFAISTLVSEFRASGIFTSYRFEPCMLLPYMNSALLFQIACEIIYLAFTLFFVINLIKNIIKEKSKYFFLFWNLVDLGISAMSVTAVVIYFYRLVCINELTAYFSETHGNEYMKFQYVGYWSEIFNYIVGSLVFLATIKFMKLLRFNKKISQLADTLSNSSRELIHFSIIFNIVFYAFIQFFYLIYGPHLNIFRTFIKSCESGILMIMGRFDIYGMQNVNQWMTQLFLFLFVVSVTFIVVNMLISILNDTFSAVRKDKLKQTNDYEIVDFMMNRFKMWTGIGRASPTTISPAELEKERKYKELEDRIDQFPDQIDRFLASISNMYMGDVKLDNMLHKGMAQKMAHKAELQQDHPMPRPMQSGVRLRPGAKGMTDVHTD